MNMIARLRGGLLPIRVNEGRWNREKFEERICPICNEDTVENESHVLYECVVWRDQRLALRHYRNFNGNLEDLFVNATRDFYVSLHVYLTNVMEVRREIMEILS